MRKPRKSHPALTGTTMRMKSLPHNGVSSLDHYNICPQEMIRTDEARKMNLVQEDLNKEPLMRKCVYTYEDKYAFARIIFSDSYIFDSHFESGNLHSAFRVMSSQEASYAGGCSFRKHVYDLYMHNDLYTSGNTQWFYFRLSNVKAGQEVTFNIKNFQKPDSLFNQGMRPLYYSTKAEEGWVRSGTDVRYYSLSPFPLSQLSMNSIGEQQQCGSGKKNNGELYCLSFSHVFEHSEDTCYFAYCLPYTYTDLQKYLYKLQSDPKRSKHVRRRLLCKSLAGNNCDLLTITAPAYSPEELNERVTVVLSSRVHPGESNASWIMHGMLEFLTSDCVVAQSLRSRYV